MTRKFIITLILVALLAAGLGIYSGSHTAVVSGGAISSAGTLTSLKQYPAPKAIANFQLTDSQGQSFNLENLKGRWSLMFFGFTQCPDVCPTALNTMASVYRGLEGDLPAIQPPQIIFVSVDPERDSPDTIANYIQFFHPRMLGATGKHPQLEALTRELGLLYTIEPHPEGDQNYAVDHTAGIILINPEGKLVGLLPAPHDVEQINRDLLTIMGTK